MDRLVFVRSVPGNRKAVTVIRAGTREYSECQIPQLLTMVVERKSEWDKVEKTKEKGTWAIYVPYLRLLNESTICERWELEMDECEIHRVVSKKFRSIDRVDAS